MFNTQLCISFVPAPLCSGHLLSQADLGNYSHATAIHVTVSYVAGTLWLPLLLGNFSPLLVTLEGLVPA